MATLKDTRLAVLLGRSMALVVALGVLTAIGVAGTCPWLCDAGATASDRCETRVSLAHHDAHAHGQPHTRWHAGDKF